MKTGRHVGVVMDHVMLQRLPSRVPLAAQTAAKHLGHPTLQLDVTVQRGQHSVFAATLVASMPMRRGQFSGVKQWPYGSGRTVRF